MSKQRKIAWAYWVVFTIAAVFLTYAAYNHKVWLTLTLPFLVTSFVKALDII